MGAGSEGTIIIVLCIWSKKTTDISPTSCCKTDKFQKLNQPSHPFITTHRLPSYLPDMSFSSETRCEPYIKSSPLTVTSASLPSYIARCIWLIDRCQFYSRCSLPNDISWKRIDGGFLAGNAVARGSRGLIDRRRRSIVARTRSTWSSRCTSLVRTFDSSRRFYSPTRLISSIS